MSWKMTEPRGRFTAFLNSFLYALRGFRYCIVHERNMRVHLSAAVLVTAFSVSYGLTAAEYGLLFFAVGLVLCAEALNTAIEKAVDAVLAAGWHTADTMGSEDKLVGCKKMGSLICEELGK